MSSSSSGRRSLIQKIKISNTIAFIVSFVAAPYTYFFRAYSTSLANIVFVIILAFLSVIILNKCRYYTVSRFVLILSANISAAYYSASFGEETGIHLLFFAYIMLPLVIFQYHEIYKMSLGALITILCIGYLEFSHYYSPTPIVTSPSFQNFIHLFIIVLVLAFNLMSTHQREKKLETFLKRLQRANSKLRYANQQMVFKKKLEAEFNLASDIQKEFLPTLPAYINGYQFHSFYVASQEVNGDYFDIKTSGNVVNMLVADVAGKGLAASFITILLHSVMHSNITRHDSPKLALFKFNKALVDARSRHCKAAAFFLTLDTVKQCINYANAGIGVAFLIRKNAITALSTGGFMLGGFNDIEYDEASVVLEKNDIIFIASDGLTDIENEHGEKFGETRIITLLQTTNFSNPDWFDSFKDKVIKFQGNASLRDDIVILSIQKQD